MERLGRETKVPRCTSRPPLLPYGIEDWFCRNFPILCPLTADETRMEKMFSQLVQKTEARSATKPTSAIVSTPILPGLTHDMLVHAASRAGLRLLSTHRHIGGLSQTSSAYAGSNRGLCRHYTDIPRCEVEMYAPPEQFVLGVHFDLAALRVVYNYMEHAVCVSSISVFHDALAWWWSQQLYTDRRPIFSTKVVRTQQ